MGYMVNVLYYHFSAFMQNVALKLNEYYNEKKHGKSTVPKQEVDQQYVFQIEDLI